MYNHLPGSLCRNLCVDLQHHGKDLLPNRELAIFSESHKKQVTDDTLSLDDLLFEFKNSF